jgi:hypothetical protein
MTNRSMNNLVFMEQSTVLCEDTQRLDANESIIFERTHHSHFKNEYQSHLIKTKNPRVHSPV